MMMRAAQQQHSFPPSLFSSFLSATVQHHERHQQTSKVAMQHWVTRFTTEPRQEAKTSVELLSLLLLPRYCVTNSSTDARCCRRRCHQLTHSAIVLLGTTERGERGRRPFARIAVTLKLMPQRQRQPGPPPPRHRERPMEWERSTNLGQAAAAAAASETVTADFSNEAAIERRSFAPSIALLQQRQHQQRRRRQKSPQRWKRMREREREREAIGAAKNPAGPAVAAAASEPPPVPAPAPFFLALATCQSVS